MEIWRSAFRVWRERITCFREPVSPSTDGMGKVAISLYLSIDSASDRVQTLLMVRHLPQWAAPFSPTSEADSVSLGLPPDSLGWLIFYCLPTSCSQKLT